MIDTLRKDMTDNLKIRERLPWYEHIDRLNLFIVMILSFDKKKKHGVYSFFTHWHRDVIYEGWLVNVWNRDLKGKSI